MKTFDIIALIPTLILVVAIISYALFVDLLPNGGWMVLGYKISNQAVVELGQ